MDARYLLAQLLMTKTAARLSLPKAPSLGKTLTTPVLKPGGGASNAARVGAATVLPAAGAIALGGPSAAERGAEIGARTGHPSLQKATANLQADPADNTGRLLAGNVYGTMVPKGLKPEPGPGLAPHRMVDAILAQGDKPAGSDPVMERAMRGVANDVVRRTQRSEGLHHPPHSSDWAHASEPSTAPPWTSHVEPSIRSWLGRLGPQAHGQ